MDETTVTTNATNSTAAEPTKFCKHCGGKIPQDAIICTLCGRQVEKMQQDSAPQIVVNNTNTNANVNANLNGGVGFGKPKNKWVSLLLCIFLGFFGAHKFYEGRIGLGILYLLTAGLFGIGVFIDFIVLLFKPNTYFVV